MVTWYASILIYQVKAKPLSIERKRERPIYNNLILSFMKKVILLIVLMVTIAIVQMSCNVTRTTTTTASTYQRGDTTIMVQTKTVESYDATKKL